jgi:hypothetical protein
MCVCELDHKAELEEGDEWLLDEDNASDMATSLLGPKMVSEMKHGVNQPGWTRGGRRWTHRRLLKSYIHTRYNGTASSCTAAGLWITPTRHHTACDKYLPFRWTGKVVPHVAVHYMHLIAKYTEAAPIHAYIPLGSSLHTGSIQTNERTDQKKQRFKMIHLSRALVLRCQNNFSATVLIVSHTPTLVSSIVSPTRRGS